MDKTKFTILGETGSGKTCYILGMYYEMSAGRDGYSIVAPNRDKSRRLVANFKKLTDASLGRKRFPEITDALQKYNFELQHAFNTILPFEWIDYPGRQLDVSESASNGLTEVENSIYSSTALFICIDGENLTGNNTKEKIERVRDKCSRHISPYLAQLSGKNRGRKFPPIALIITKFDLCNRETDEEEILEVLQCSFSPLFERNDTFIVIVPVSLGSDLQDDDSRGKFSPINLHLPIYMGIWFALKNQGLLVNSKLRSDEEFFRLTRRQREGNATLHPIWFGVFAPIGESVKQIVPSLLKRPRNNEVRRKNNRHLSEFTNSP